jgi:ribonuclease P protein component
MKYLRLKKKKDFTKILKAGKRCFSSSLTVVYLPSDRVKMAVCVGKKYGKSVKRNHIKRLLREAFRSQCEKMKPYSFLLIPKVDQEYSVACFARDIEKICKREKLFATIST